MGNFYDQPENSKRGMFFLDCFSKNGAKEQRQREVPASTPRYLYVFSMFCLFMTLVICFLFQDLFFRASLRFLRLMVFCVPFPVSTAKAQVKAVASPQAMGMNANIYPPEKNEYY